MDRTIPGVDLEKVEDMEEDVTGPEMKDSEVTLEAETGLGINLRAVSFSEQSRRRDLTPGYFVDTPGQSSSQE